MNNELVEVSETTALAAFATPAGLDPIISQARELVESFEPDLSTDKGRKAIASLAGKVAKLKVKLDDAGKELVSEWKSKSKIVDGSRKSMRDELDALKIQARAPLTEWENKEKDRVQAHRESIDYIDGWVAQHNSDGIKLTIADLELAREHVIEVDTGELEEFELEGVKVKEKAVNVLTGWIEEEQKRLDTEDELERLRIAEVARKQKERDEQMKREAAEEATRQAEDKAAREAERSAKERRAATEREERVRSEAAESERQRISAEERAKLEAEQAEKNRVAAEEQAKINADAAAENARLAEIKRQEDAEKAEKIETEKREANKRHVGKIRKAAKEDLMQILGIKEKDAVSIVMAVTKGLISNVTINY